MRIDDLDFEPFISEEIINKTVKTMALEISRFYENKEIPEVIVVLSGAFVFAADLLRACTFSPNIHFVKVSSYRGNTSSGKIQEELMLLESIQGKPLLVIEDILDTGLTWTYLQNRFSELGCSDISLAALFVKKSFDSSEIKSFFKGIVLENEFVVGYGLDYKGLGRNLKDVYKVKS